MNTTKNLIQNFCLVVLITSGFLLLLQGFNLIYFFPTPLLQKVFFAAIVITLITLLDQNLIKISELLEALGLTKNQIKEYVVFPLLVALKTFVIYITIIIPTEYLLTEKYLILKYIRGDQKTYIFLTIFLLAFLADYFSQKANRVGQRYWQVILALFIALLCVNRAYTGYYNELQKQPRIYSVNSNWSIIGMPIAIDGKNFGPIWQRGAVKVNDFEFIIKEWDKEKIIAVQPAPKKYFTGELVVSNHFGNESNKVGFKIRNPNELTNN